ncbi:DNA cytosine methyltransferase [Candidatus Woesearchaeota archaeon]|nr:DNA cytosine methyltransferase [Candidatus Woesearchaeota archaeon]
MAHGINKTTNDFSSPAFIDLFAGIGGIRIGFERAGFNCVYSSENNDECRKTYYRNFGEWPDGDITKVDERYVPNHSILTAGFPCQPFSAAGRKKGFDDTRGTLFFDILRILKEKKPEVVFLENVKNLKYHDKRRTLSIMLKHLEELGYLISWRILNGKDFGCPTNRERTVIIGSKTKKFDFTRLKRLPPVHLKDILENEGQFYYLKSPQYTLISQELIKEQDSGLVFVGYRNKPIRTNGVRPNTEHLSRVHRQCNRIYSSDGTHPTIASQEPTGRYHIYHNGKVRRLTINECFSIMGFPKSFKKVSTNGDLYKQIGNSVCVPMVEQVAKEIRRQLF